MMVAHGGLSRVWGGASDPQQFVHILWGGASDPQEFVHILWGGASDPQQFVHILGGGVAHYFRRAPPPRSKVRMIRVNAVLLAYHTCHDLMKTS